MRTAALLSAIAALAAAAAGAQIDNCSDCHLSRPDAPRPDHVADWSRSAHAAADVGCHECHGGRTDSFEPFTAHEGVGRGGDPQSPVHRSRLVTTCGRCHAAQLVEFRKSRHYELLTSGEDGPTCSTCHGSNAGFLLSPRALERRCARCHAEGRVGGHPEHPALARDLHDHVIEIRELLRPAQKLVRHVDDPERRAQLQRQYDQAEVPLLEAVQLGHAFSADGVEERLSVAQARAEALMEALANAGPAEPRKE